MAVSAYLGYIFLTLVLIRFLLRFLDNNDLPRSWPIIGMLPTMLLHIHRMHDKIPEVLEKSKGTFLYKGIWFTNTSFLGTSDPENVRFVMSTNSSIYVKGSEWMKQFDIFGEALFNSDGEAWKRQRKIFHAFLNHPFFHKSMAKLIPDRIEQGLVQVLEHASKRELMVDLQDLLARHAFDIACIMATGCNPRLLSLEFPENRFHMAMSAAWEAAFYRYVMPDNLWKLLSWLQIGREKRRSRAWKSLDDLLAEYISIQRGKSSKAIASSDENDEENFNFLKCYLTGNEVTGPTPSDSLIRDNLIHIMFATDDTNSTVLSWFFYLLSKNPMVETKIREELKQNLSFKQAGECELLSSLNELNKLAYLHAALCETLRLYPPVPFEFRKATEKNILPSGHCIEKNMRVAMAIHAMGRMTSVWGKDCNEFKPERWMTEEGKIKRELPSKFLAFNAGPRICLGKDFAFIIMKSTAATIIHNYNIGVLQGQKVTPKNSIILHMKHGLKVSVKNRRT
ncbi:hypothetical protein DITRI_Ditri08aG0115300 [Diplodiscus trichospermus]